MIDSPVEAYLHTIPHPPRTLTMIARGLLTLLMIGTGVPLCRAEPPPAATTSTYVLVHGAWGGGWAFKEVDRLLTADGHKVYRPTLTGLGESHHLANPGIDLTTHITDVVNVLVWEDLHDVVLVGHSYGGMVITGVADRVPERIRHIVYLDAFAPNNGESWESLGALPAGVASRDGGLVPPWLNPDAPPPHDVPHPAGTRTQPISLTHPAREKLPATYILTADDATHPEVDRFYPHYLRAKERGWHVVIMSGGHNVQWSNPQELVRLLETSAVVKISRQP